MHCLFGDSRWNRILQFLRSEDGPTAVEYAVMLAFMIVACLASIQTIGTRVNTLFLQASVGW